MLGKFVNDDGGNVAIIFSGVILLLLGAIGGAVDVTQMLANKQKVADIADSTALAAALVAREQHSNRMEISKRHFSENVSLARSVEVRDDVSIEFDDSAKEVTVTVAAKTNFFLLHLFGHKANDVTASSTVGFAIDYVPPISIAFAFDTSGSMGWPTTDGRVKIDALEAATSDLFDAMFAASERPTLLTSALSTAFSTFNTGLIINDTPRNGYQHILDTMRDDPLFVPSGGTDSTPSVDFAVAQLTAADTAESDTKWSGHLIFMTDGQNNDPQSNIDTLSACTNAKALGYTVYTVAFALDATIPAARDLLEGCASDPSNFFESADADALKNSFEIIGKQLGEATVRIKR